MIEIKYLTGKNPNTGKPYGQQEVKSGSMQKDVPVEFHFHTSTVADGFSADKSTNGNFFVVAPSDNNCSFTGEFRTFPPGTPGTLLGGSGASSFHWSFKKAFALQPDTDYSVVVTADADCAGFTGKLNPGY